jgi:hypothetical protein
MQIQNARTFFQNTASILGTPVKALTATGKAESEEGSGEEENCASREEVEPEPLGSSIRRIDVGRVAGATRIYR